MHLIYTTKLEQKAYKISQKYSTLKCIWSYIISRKFPSYIYIFYTYYISEKFHCKLAQKRGVTK